jgi:hypothetical protein
MIVSPEDCQVYEKKIPSYKKEINYMHELIAYASLDMVELSEWQTNNMFMKQVDKFNDSIIHCFVTPGRMRFLLLHEGISDDYIKAYNQLIENLRFWCKYHNYQYEFCFSSNLVFNKTDRVLEFLKFNKEDTYIATSYDPVARFHTKEVEDIWWKNVELFNPKVISITLTKPAIEKYITTDVLNRLSKYEIYPEYYIYNKDWKIYAPTGEELFEFFKYCYQNNINIPELTSIVNNYKTKTGNRYCYCFNSCSFINGRLVFSCLLRSGTMSMLSEYGMTLDQCYDNDHCTEKQFSITVSRLKCLNCKFYNICRLPCIASKMHKEEEKNTCHLKLFYTWLEDCKC